MLSVVMSVVKMRTTTSVILVYGFFILPITIHGFLIVRNTSGK